MFVPGPITGAEALRILLNLASSVGWFVTTTMAETPPPLTLRRDAAADHGACGATRAELAASVCASRRASAELAADALGALRARHGTFRPRLAATMHGWDVLERLLEEDMLTARRRVDDALARLVLREFAALEAVPAHPVSSCLFLPVPRRCRLRW